MVHNKHKMYKNDCQLMQQNKARQGYGINQLTTQSNTAQSITMHKCNNKDDV